MSVAQLPPQEIRREINADVPPAMLDSTSDFFQALRDHPDSDPVILDFDETLWLRNSTEQFLDSVRPRFLAAMVLQILGFLRPWRLFQKGKPNHYRCWIRVLAVLCVAPWSLWWWRRQAPRLARTCVNRPLLDAVLARHPERVGVVTLGFREIVAPLLANLDGNLPLIESYSLRNGAQLRKEGKAHSIARHYGADRLRRSLVITDSEADSDLLQASERSFLVQWPDAKYEQAGLRPLVPFVYLQRVKRPDENYLRNAVLGHDLPVLLLAYAVASDHFLFAAGAILLLVLGFFASYETGYHENDRLGLKLEDKPKVSPNFHTLGRHFSPTFAWSAALFLTGIGCFLAYRSHSWVPDVLQLSGPAGFLTVWAAFVAFLIGMRLLFHWQNVVQPRGRIVPMLGLQVGRTLGYAIILPTTIIGALFCVAHGVSRWIPYMIYRFGGSREGVPNHLNALMLLIFFTAAVAIGGGLEPFLNWQSALIFAYAGLRGGKDLLGFGRTLVPLTGRRPRRQPGSSEALKPCQ